MFIGLLFFYNLVTKKRSKQYFRDNAKKNYKLNMELSKRYKIEGKIGETFSKFRQRTKKDLG